MQIKRTQKTKKQTNQRGEIQGYRALGIRVITPILTFPYNTLWTKLNQLICTLVFSNPSPKEYSQPLLISHLIIINTSIELVRAEALTLRRILLQRLIRHLPKALLVEIGSFIKHGFIMLHCFAGAVVEEKNKRNR